MTDIDLRIVRFSSAGSLAEFVKECLLENPLAVISFQVCTEGASGDTSDGGIATFVVAFPLSSKFDDTMKKYADLEII